MNPKPIGAEEAMDDVNKLPYSWCNECQASMPTEHAVHGDKPVTDKWFCASHQQWEGVVPAPDTEDVNIITTAPVEGTVSLHIICECIDCVNRRVAEEAVVGPYGSYTWYRQHIQELAEAEWQAHDHKRLDYCGDKYNIFWMIDDIMADSGYDFETIWIAWATRHFRGMLRAMRQGYYQNAAKRALDLMGWLFLLLAKYKPRNSQ